MHMHSHAHAHVYIYIYFLSDEGSMLETLDHTFRIGSTPTFLYFDLYLYSAYAAHYVYIYIVIVYNAALFSGSTNNYRVVMILTTWDVVTSSETVGFC